MALVLTELQANILKDGDSRLYALRFIGEDHDRVRAGESDVVCTVGIVTDPDQLVALTRGLINALVDFGETQRVIDSILEDVRRRAGELN